MIVRIDARRLTDSAALHATLCDAFGFPASYGKNLDALVDCLSDLDKPQNAGSRLQEIPGQLALLVIEHAEAATKAQKAQVQSLIDVVAFVNWRRLEAGERPVLTIAYDAS